jgi:DNA-binding CsgD family transcriptional regulator
VQGRGGIIGRTAELEVLGNRLATARAGRGGVVLVGGEPGIGKTTLAAEMTDAARRAGMIATWGRCREDGDAPPYRPWLQVLRQVLEAVGPPPGAPGLDPRLSALLEPAGGGAPVSLEASDRFGLFEAMSSVLARTGSLGVLAVLDDLHRADDASLAFLRYLAAELDQMPVVVVGAYRDSEVGRDHPLTAAIGAMADGGALQVLSLRGLSHRDVRTLVERHAGALSEEVTDQVIARAEGNPFFVVEIARLLRDAPGGPSKLAATAIPPTVRDVITHRLGRLPSQSLRAIRAAAVFGRDFGQLPLGAALGASPVAVAGALQPAAAAGLIAAEGNRGYSFIHALVQEVVYDGLPIEERTNLHRRAAAAISSVDRTDDETLGAIAYHSYRASLDGDAGPALAQVLAAARRARDRLAFEEAVRWMGCALDLAGRVDVDAEEYAALLCETADAEVEAGDAASARRHYETVADMAQRQKDGAMLARAALGAGSTVVTAGKVDWALVRLLERAGTLIGDEATRARLLSRRAIELYWHEGSEPSRELSLAALSSAEASGNREAIAVALHARQFTLRGPDHLEPRIAIGERLMELTARAGDTELSFHGAVWLAADVMRAGNLPRFRRLTQSLEAMAARARRPLWRWYATVMQAQLAAVEGRVDDAYLATEAAAALGDRLDVEVAAAYRLGQLCVLHRERHGLALLLAAIQDVATRLPYFITIRALSALAAATSGHTGEARAGLDQLSGDRFEVVPRDSLWVATVALLLEASALSGSTHTETLVELLTPQRGTFVVQGLPNCWGSVDRFLGVGQLALGDLEAARRCIDDAWRMESALGAPLFVARTTLLRARLAVALGDTAQAADLSAAVEASAVRLHLDALADEARGVRGDPRPRRGGLSPREREVLLLLSGGATNKDIASSLFISLNTVERHVANIYAKLGVRGRAEAAAHAVRAGLAPQAGNGGFP